MTEKQKYIDACRFAINALMKRGSSCVLLDVYGEHNILKWHDVLEWLDGEYEKGE